QNGVQITVLEAALLFEAKWDDLADEVWVTAVAPEIAARRTSERSGLPEDQVLERIKSQISNEERTRNAHVVIDTEGDLEGTKQQALDAWAKLTARLDANDTGA
ncbi:MAG: dephospho-CoA kinase, partial [Chloroflexi bacterium]|nr:dephospho-CoA kinase [Chloroflexota bacterium]